MLLDQALEKFPFTLELRDSANGTIRPLGLDLKRTKKTSASAADPVGVARASGRTGQSCWAGK